MRKYRANAASAIRIDYGVELAAGLKAFDETAPLAEPFAALNDELDAAHSARVAKRKPMVEARTALRFANYHVDQTIRMCARAAEIADGGRRGPVFEAAFPSGVSPVVAPAGRRQVKPAAELVERIEKSSLESMVAFRSEWQPKLGAALETLKKAAADYDAARDAHLDAFRSELALRDEHLLAVDRLMGQIRSTFPGDRTRQDVIFPVAVATSADDDSGDEPGPSPSPSE